MSRTDSKKINIEEDSHKTLNTDVLIIGAGPAGSTAAGVLAGRGLDVILIDKCNFPREKVCGGGIVTDTIKALSYLGLVDRVFKSALLINRIQIFSPNDSNISIEGKFASISRLVFDEILRSHAIESGCKFLSPFILEDALIGEGRISGATFRRGGENKQVSIKATYTLLATGANLKPLQIFQVCERKHPSAVASRACYRVNPTLATKYKDFYVSYNRDNCPGYGWVFPGPEFSFNIGVGYFFDTKKKPKITNLKRLWTQFVENFPIAREIVDQAVEILPLTGASLRTGLSGSLINKAGLLVLGDAAGLTYPFSGEGIGKAMESGIIAAEILEKYFLKASIPYAEIDTLYKATVYDRFYFRYKAYKRAQKILSVPFLTNFLFWRANNGNHVMKKLKNLIEETDDPRRIFSFSEFIKSLIS
jgi:geranylgeranyl reductase family protein